MLLFRNSLQLSVEPLMPMWSATPSMLEQLPAYIYLIKEHILLDCFDRSDYFLNVH